MTGKKNVEKSGGKSGNATTFKKGADPRRAKGPKKGAPNAGRPPSEVKKALLAGFEGAMPELLRIAKEGASEGDRLRAIDVLGKYAGLTSIDVEITRPVSLVIEGLE